MWSRSGCERNRANRVVARTGDPHDGDLRDEDREEQGASNEAAQINVDLEMQRAAIDGERRWFGHGKLLFYRLRARRTLGAPVLASAATSATPHAGAQVAARPQQFSVR